MESSSNHQNPYPIQTHFLSTPTIPKGKRSGRPRTNYQSSKQQTNSIASYSNKRNTPYISDDIIFINKKSAAEASIALTSGFPADFLTDEEIEFGVVSDIDGIEFDNYILIRNHIITKWRENVKRFLTKEMFVNIVPQHCLGLLDRTYRYLVTYGYINFGVAPEIKVRVLREKNKGKVIVIGAGLAGLAAARQLMSFGFSVTVLEGRKRAGGRVFTRRLAGFVDGRRVVAHADLGGSVLTGMLGNPLGILARQLSCKLLKIKDKCPLYGTDGREVDPELDGEVEARFNKLLGKVDKIRKKMGAVLQGVSLGSALETYVGDISEEERKLLDWHFANLEFANAELLSNLSLRFWDQDDRFDMGGDHCILYGGNGRLIEALVEDVPIQYEEVVHEIQYGSNGVRVIAGSHVFVGEMVLCTVPLGVLKNGYIRFDPELPESKLEGIKRLGFGLLNKVVMLFPHAFWGTDLDFFGHLSDNTGDRGELFMFYNYATVAGGALLIGFVAGEAAYNIESISSEEAMEKAVKILKDIYEPKGIDVPKPISFLCTRWSADKLSCGSYSSVAVGASGDVYDILAESVGDGRLFFAGEATSRRYPATMHGALLSGFREAANIALHAKIRSVGSKVESTHSANAHDCASILTDLFRSPDVEFGSFAVIYGKKKSSSLAILRVKFDRQRKRPDQRYSNELLFEQLQSRFNQGREFHFYGLISKQQAFELREVKGGDEARLKYLCKKIGVKPIGRKGLGPAADSVIASIRADRSQRWREDSAGSKSKSKPKAPAGEQKLIRRAQIQRSGNKSSICTEVDSSDVMVSKVGPTDILRGECAKVTAMQLLQFQIMVTSLCLILVVLILTIRLMIYP